MCKIRVERLYDIAYDAYNSIYRVIWDWGSCCIRGLQATLPHRPSLRCMPCSSSIPQPLRKSPSFGPGRSPLPPCSALAKQSESTQCAFEEAHVRPGWCPTQVVSSGWRQDERVRICAPQTGPVPVHELQPWYSRAPLLFTYVACVMVPLPRARTACMRATWLSERRIRF